VAVDLFVGLVTHPKSRFPESATMQGLMMQVAQGASVAGLRVHTGASDKDAFPGDSLPVSRSMVRRSIAAELEVERRWRRYLRGGSEPCWMGSFFAARCVARMLRSGMPWRSSQQDGLRMVRRLANIEASHLRIMDMALDSGADWVLLLEDDAQSPDGNEFGRLLAGFIRSNRDQSQPQMVSLSESFSSDDLGISPLLSPVPAARGPWPMQAAERVVTNTLCATLYRRGFLKMIVAALHEIPLEPVVPIDFKLNLAIMAVDARCDSGDSWIASPAPLEQRSGVPAVRFGKSSGGA